MNLDSRKVVIAGGASGVEPLFDIQRVAPALTTDTASVVEVVEIGRDGSILSPAEEWHHDPERDGSILRIVTLKPVPTGEVRPLHASPTVDFGVVLMGTVELALPGGRSTVLDTGDSFVLRGVDHAWTNRGPGDCQLAVTLLAPSEWDLSRDHGSVEA